MNLYDKYTYKKSSSLAEKIRCRLQGKPFNVWCLNFSAAY